MPVLPPIISALTEGEIAALRTIITLLPQASVRTTLSNKLELALRCVETVKKATPGYYPNKLFGITGADTVIEVSSGDTIKFVKCPSILSLNRRNTGDMNTTEFGNLCMQTNKKTEDSTGYDNIYIPLNITASEGKPYSGGSINLTYTETILLHAFLDYHIKSWRNGLDGYVVDSEQEVVQTQT